MKRHRRFAPALCGLVVALSASPALAGIRWRSEIRGALEEAEDRGVPLLVYLSRDD